MIFFIGDFSSTCCYFTTLYMVAKTSNLYSFGFAMNWAGANSLAMNCPSAPDVEKIKWQIGLQFSVQITVNI
jgi:hypothetical protein